jgi:dTDP-glucose 4,6-dehydratase
VRDWLYVEDHCEGILSVLERGRPGEQYAFGGDSERTNLEIVDQLCAILDELLPTAANPSMRQRGLDRYADLKSFVEDRPGHDRRYAIDASKVRSELDWRPRHDLDGGLRQTVRWYLEHREWCEAVQRDRYGRERLGLAGRKP